jgi:integrase
MKGKSDHDVPLSADAHSILQSIRAMCGGDGLVFSTNGVTSVTGFSKAKRRLDTAMLELSRERSAGASRDFVPTAPWTLHDLRRTLVTGLPRLGVAVAVAEKIIDHKSGTFGGVVGVYQRHEFADERRKALDAWALHVRSIVQARRA